MFPKYSAWCPMIWRWSTTWFFIKSQGLCDDRGLVDGFQPRVERSTWSWVNLFLPIVRKLLEDGVIGWSYHGAPGQEVRTGGDALLFDLEARLGGCT